MKCDRYSPSGKSLEPRAITLINCDSVDPRRTRRGEYRSIWLAVRTLALVASSSPLSNEISWPCGVMAISTIFIS